jgi:nitronate monooxygenase
MGRWPDQRLLELLGIELPIIQAPMAGNTTPELVIAVCEAGGLGSLACAQYDLRQARDAMEAVQAGTTRPFNVNFFCHTPPAPDAAALLRWRAALAVYYVELGLDPAAVPPAGGRTPFGAEFCGLVEEFRPAVVSFHFGLPDQVLLDRVKATGTRIIASATTVAEARFLAARGCDAVIAMGLEAGGHRGNFLGDDMARQVGLFALLPQVVDAVRVPVIAAGGIADGRTIAAAFALGAAAVQIGTAYLFADEAKVPAVHRAALKEAGDDATALTNVFTGRPARGIVNRLMREIGPISAVAPAFPLAGGAIAPLRAKTEAAGLGDFVNLWSGQAAALAKAMPAGEMTRVLAQEALERMEGLVRK